MSSGSSGHRVTAPELLYSILFLIRRIAGMDKVYTGVVRGKWV